MLFFYTQGLFAESKKTNPLCLGCFYFMENIMSKDPAILFYTSDFICGTALMTYEEKGQYIYLLCLQHQTGHLTKEDLDNVTKSERVLSKFTMGFDGKFHNLRLHEEIIKRKTYCDSRKKNREKGWEKEHKANICSTYVEHMENEDVNINKDVDVNKKKGIVKGEKHSELINKNNSNPNRSPSPAPLSNSVFINALKANPAYKHINIDTELSKIDAWLLTRKGRLKTKRFVVNWLNKIDRPLTTQRVEQTKTYNNGCPACGGSGKVKAGNLKGAECYCVRLFSEKR